MEEMLEETSSFDTGASETGIVAGVGTDSVDIHSGVSDIVEVETLLSQSLFLSPPSILS